MKKLKVMIVDDEILAIQDLKNMINWGEYGFEIVASATNGRRAFEAFKSKKPDIVIVDIIMPIMDGLEFSKEAFKEDRNVKIILLTAYKDFEYAKQAFELGISNYLLKHEINPVSLVREISKVRQAIGQDRLNFHVGRSNYYKKVLMDENMQASQVNGDECSLYKIRNSTVLLYTIQDEPFPVIPAGISESSIIFDEEIIHAMDFCNELNYIENICISSGKFVILLEVNHLHSENELRNKLFSLIRLFQEKITAKYGVTVSIIMGKSEKGMNDIAALFNKLKRISCYMVFEGTERICFHDEIKLPEYKDTLAAEQELECICSCIDNLRLEEAVDHLHLLFTNIMKDKNLQALKRACKEIVYSIEKLQKGYHVQTLEDKVLSDKSIYKKWHTVSGICDWFSRELMQLFHGAMIKDIRTLNYSRIYSETLEYIDKYYHMSDLSQEKVAEYIGISPGYLSKKIKMEANKTFLEILTEYRIQKAKELLKNSNYKMYEIGEMVGYNTSQYFSKVFYKVTGKNPFEFRENRGNSL